MNDSILKGMSWDKRINKINENEDLIYQVLDFHCDDEEYKFKIYTFGVDLHGRPVSVRFDNFFPWFFIEVPSSWNSDCVGYIKNALNSKSIKKITFLQRKRYYGFENNKTRKFCKLEFFSDRSRRYMAKQILENKYLISGKEYLFEVYESNIDPVLRFCHIQDILTAGWVKIPAGSFTLDGDLVTSEYKNVKYHDLDNKISNIRTMFFDIEACSEDGSFPDPTKPHDKVTQVCCILSDLEGEPKNYLFNLDTIDKILDCTVLTFKSEKKLLIALSNFIRDTNPDIIVGYNIFGFDNGFLFERAKVLDIENTFNYQSKLPEKLTEIKAKVLNNQQSGFNDWKMTKIYGRLHIDLLQVIKKDFKLDSYKLNNVGEHFLGEGKDDVSPKEIFEAWSQDLGTTEKRTIVGKYCIQDTLLCYKLYNKFAVLQNHIEMAKVTRVPLEYLITRGQSIKVFSQIAYETRKAGYLIPVLKVAKPSDEVQFQGATVLDAKVGYYTKPVAGLDFASLYPSIMIAHNMCYSTVVLDDKYLHLPDVEYSSIEWTDTAGVKFKFTFVQNQPGVLSGILQTLWKNRKVTKREMNATQDQFVKTILNAKQLAIKVSMNSIYGFTGAVVGALPCLAISQSVTGCGRQMIEQTSSLAVSQFGCEVIYGDSVTGETPVLVRQNGKVSTIEIEELFNKFEQQEYPQFKPNENLENKQQSIPTTLIEIWTASGWSPLRRTVRHYCKKDIYRIITPTGLVDVTEDHSLLSMNLEQIKPAELSVGMVLFHSFPDLEGTHNNPFFYENYCKLKVLQEQYLHMKYKGYRVSITYDNDEIKLNYYESGQQFVENEKQVTHIRNLGKSETWVYDLETEDGTFQAGIGEMIVKNTDSCYVIFPEPANTDGTLTELFKLAEHAAAEISKTFKKPIELEFEKFMWPLILVAKKRYMYLEWTKPDIHNGCIEAKGVELVRRDNCQYVKETLDRVLTPIMFKNDLETGKVNAEECIDNLLNGKVDLSKLVISKTLRNEYKNPDVIAHYQLVEKMKNRDPNSAPKPGDRVPFVYVDIGDPKSLAWKKIEDPKYVIENNIPIDYLYYLEHQLKNPLKTIFDILLNGKSDQLFDRKSFQDAKKREKLSIGEAKRIKEKNADIRGFFKVNVKI